MVGTSAPVGDAADDKTALVPRVDGRSADAPHSTRVPGFGVMLTDEFFRLLRALLRASI